MIEFVPAVQVKIAFGARRLGHGSLNNRRIVHSVVAQCVMNVMFRFHPSKDRKTLVEISRRVIDEVGGPIELIPPPFQEAAVTLRGIHAPGRGNFWTAAYQEGGPFG